LAPIVQTLSPGFDPVEARQRLDVHQHLRLGDVFLHLAQQIYAAGKVAPLVGDQFAGAAASAPVV